MDVLNSLASFFSSHYAIDAYKFLAGGTGIAIVVQSLKKKLNFDKAEVNLFKFIKLDGSKIALGITGFITACASVSEYFISHATATPIPAMGLEGAKLLAAATVVHRYAVSPISTKIENTITSLIKDANAYRAEQVTTPTVNDNQFTG